jgi:ribosomal protein L18E
MTAVDNLTDDFSVDEINVAERTLVNILVDTPNQKDAKLWKAMPWRLQLQALKNQSEG